MSEEKTPREKFAGLKFSQMRGSTIQDSEANQLGKLQDAIFLRTEDGFELTKFLIGGSFWEELMEDLGRRPDIDPVFSISVIEGVSPKGMRLNVAKEDLKSTTLDEDAIEEGEFKLSDLGKFKLVDSEGESIGNIIDVTFSHNAFQFIIGDGFIKELAEDIGILSDVDFLLEAGYISEFDLDSKMIKLETDKLALKETFEKHLPEDKTDKDQQYNEFRKTMYFPRSTF